MKTFLYNTLVFLCMVNYTTAQNITSQLEQLVQKAVDHEYFSSVYVSDMCAENLPDSLIPLLKQYETYPNYYVQRNIFYFYYEYARMSPDSSFKRRMMKHLLNACACPDSIELSYACTQSIRLLRDFENSLFDQSMIDTINKRVKIDDKNSLDFAYLSGKLYQYQMIPVIEEMLHKETWGASKLKWNIILARLGQKEGIDKVVESLKKRSMDGSKWVENTIFYTLQKPVIDILFDDLESNKTMSYKLIYGDAVPGEKIFALIPARILRKLVKDFPKYDYDLSEPENLEIIRAWAMKHREDYEIISE